ncbi:MAG: transcription elongation factor Spt5 [Candidatus Methanomethylicia archaeon]
MSVYAVRCTSGQEKNIAILLEQRVRTENIPLKSIVVPINIRGFFFIEADGPHIVERAILGLKHVKGLIPGKTEISSIEHLILPKPTIESLNIGDTVEIVSGPFRNMRARISRINKDKQEVVLELLEATYSLPITMKADYVKKIIEGEFHG